MQILRTGVGGGFFGDRQFEGAAHMKDLRHVQFAMRSASPLKSAFHHTLLNDMLQDYRGRLPSVRRLTVAVHAKCGSAAHRAG